MTVPTLKAVPNSNVRVGFSTPKRFNPVSWLVRKVTGSRASHAWFLYFSETFDIEMVAEAHELGFRIQPYDRFKKDNMVVAVFTPKYPLDEGLKKVVQRYLATGYDWGGLFGMAVVKLGKMLKRRWRNPFSSPKHVFCSEAVYQAMKWSPGYDDLTDAPDSEDPELLMEHLEKHEV